MSEGRFSQQVEWFHQFAKLSVEQLAQLANEENRSLFLQYVRASLPKHDPPEAQSPDEFAHAVVGLRENERQWNRALMTALVDADDLHNARAAKEAVEKLNAFADSCPWKLFEDVARGQAAKYEARG